MFQNSGIFHQCAELFRKALILNFVFIVLPSRLRSLNNFSCKQKKWMKQWNKLKISTSTLNYSRTIPPGKWLANQQPAAKHRNSRVMHFSCNCKLTVFIAWSALWQIINYFRLGVFFTILKTFYSGFYFHKIFFVSRAIQAN